MFLRVTALIMLVITVTMNVEVGFGLARDGEVHHESDAEAVVHAQSRVGPVVGHGHEDLQEDPSHGDDSHASSEAHDDHPSHDHGTCLDHCTHLHAPAIPGHAPTPAPARFLSVRPLVTAELPYEGSHDTLFHPPRA